MSNITFFETMFDVQVSLCERYNSLNILDLRQYPLHEVFLLFNRTLNWIERKEKSNKNKVTNNNRIMRPASDNWF